MKKIMFVVLLAIAFLAGCDFTFDKVKITFDDNFGNTTTREITKGSILNEEDALKILENGIEHEGYKFICWTLDNEEFDYKNGINNDITLIAKWEKIEVEKIIVTFNDTFGNTITKEVTDGKVEIVNPVKDGYTFIYWALNDEEYDFSNDITESITLIAKWEKIEVEKIIVTFDDTFGNTITKEVIDGKVEIVNPVQDGYTFIYWTLNDKEYDFSNDITESITLIAKWEKTEVEKIIVTFDDTFGNTITKEVIDGKVEIVNPVKDGYTFIYWTLNDKEYDFSNDITESITLIAKWEKITVTFDDTFGNTITKEVTDGKVEIVNPVKDGYTFIYWTLNDEEYDFNKNITESITLIAKWEEIKTYKVTFTDYDDSIISIIYVKNGDTLELPNEPKRIGYTFASWDKELTTDITSDITVKAIYEIINYSISYDSVTDNALTFNVLSNITLTSPKKDGFTFLGWTNNDREIKIINEENVYDLISNTINDVLYLNAKWEEIKKNTVSVEFDLNGGEFNETDLNKFPKGKEVINSFNVTKYDVDYWDYWNGNILLSPASSKPTATYSIRIGITEKEDYFVIQKIYTSGTVSGDTDFSDCSYVIVCAESYSTGYQSVNVSSLKVGDYLSFETLDLSNIESGDINSLVTIYRLSDIIEYKLSYQENTILPIPTRNGYEFNGWNDGNNLITELIVMKDEKLTLTASWKYVGLNEEETVEKLADDFGLILQNEIYQDLSLSTKDEETGASFVWSSNNEAVISNTGIVKRVVGKRTNVLLSLTITLGNTTKKYTYDVAVRMGYKDIYNGGVIAGYNYTSNTPNQTTLNAIDILYCAFGSAGTNGKITNISEIGTYTARYVDSAHSYGDYVILCVNTSNLATVATSASLRKVFIDEVIKAINDFNLDGVDIDWETPTTATKTNFTALMRELYTAVKSNNPEDLVTAATAGGPWQYPRFDLENSIKYIDFINLMTYDLQTNEKASHHNALYKSSKGYTLTQCTIDQSIPLYNACNVPNSKILIGIPFYGRKFKNTDGIGQSSSADGSTTYEYVTKNYLTKTDPNVILGWDDECKVPYIYDGNTRTFISYDNPKSIGIKAEYIKEKGLAGMMYWQNSQDYNNILVTSMKNCQEIMRFSK